jgi:hypothetical protein
MKHLYKVFILTIAVTVFSCDNLDLDLQENPNAVPPEQAELDFLYNNIQLNFENFFSNVFFRTAPLARMTVDVGGYTYPSANPPGEYNGLWNIVYAQLFPDMAVLYQTADEQGLSVYSGSSRIMQAYVLMTMVDLFNDIPYTEAGLGGEGNFNPGRDAGASVYQAAIGLLDQAIADLENGELNAAAPGVDNFYGGDAASWATLAKTLKLKAYLNTGDAAGFNGIISGGDFISSAAQDFQFNFGTSRANPNTRHVLYNDYYEVADGEYQNNYYMWLLRAEKGVDANDNDIRDPRINFYFYRQDGDLSNNDVNEFSCHWSDFPDLIDGGNATPAYYTAVDPRMPYCITSVDGYYGRDHLNGEGIPPDGPSRAAWGLYPAGGKFDYEDYTNIQNSGTDGALGEGIWPIMLSSYVDFMRAEAALTLGTGEDAEALMLEGISKSMAKVRSFASLINTSLVVDSDFQTGADITLEQKYLAPWDSLATNYGQIVADRFAAESDKLDVVAKEFLITAFGNGLEAYNMYRRTGKPNNMQPAIEVDPGPFNWLHFYPLDHVNLNQNATQRGSLDEQPFWATLPAGELY